MKTRTVLVPAHVAIVVDRDGIRIAEPPPRWWVELTDPDVADVPQPVVTVATRGRSPDVVPARPRSV